jgi:vesicular inhibitory amino acid transporter
MEDPIQFDGMINWAFVGFSVLFADAIVVDHTRTKVVATLTYGLIGASGYLMFGRTVTDEVSKQALPFYSP